MRCVSSTEAIKRQDSRNDAAVNQNVRNASYCWNDIKKEIQLSGQKRIARLQRGGGDDCIPGEEERLGGHQPSEPLHDEIIFVLDLIRMVRYQSDGPNTLTGGMLMGFGPGYPAARRCIQNCPRVKIPSDPRTRVTALAVFCCRAAISWAFFRGSSFRAWRRETIRHARPRCAHNRPRGGR